MLAADTDSPQVSRGSGGSNGRVTRAEHALGSGWFEHNAADEKANDQCHEISDVGTKHQR